MSAFRGGFFYLARCHHSRSWLESVALIALDDFWLGFEIEASNPGMWNFIRGIAGIPTEFLFPCIRVA